MATCPWYVSAAAVRRYCSLRRRDLDPERDADFARAEDELLEVCAQTWTHYQREGKKPKLARSGGAYVYRTTQRYGKIHLLVSTAPRPEGPKDQLVDVWPAFEGHERPHPLSRAPSKT